MTNVEVITAIREYENPEKISCFLGGGITNCDDWQRTVIDTIKSSNIDTSSLILYNPRRPNFPIDDPNASEDQINWEFKYLSDCDIFTMYFCNTKESDQPICFYELGRYVTKKVEEEPDYVDKIIVSVEDGFRREADVIYQLRNIDPYIEVNTASTPEEHARRILSKYKKLTTAYNM